MSGIPLPPPPPLLPPLTTLLSPLAPLKLTRSISINPTQITERDMKTGENKITKIYYFRILSIDNYLATTD